MKKGAWCTGRQVVRRRRATAKDKPLFLPTHLGTRPRRVKRKKITCPDCGRRLRESVEFETNDWDDVVYRVPRHRMTIKRHKKPSKRQR